MLVKNQDNLNKVDLESNSIRIFETVTRKSNRKLGAHKTDVSKGSNRYKSLSTNDNDDYFAIHTIVVPSSDSCISPDRISDEISSGNMQKKIKYFQ